MEDCETNDCRKEKLTCEGCFYRKQKELEEMDAKSVYKAVRNKIDKELLKWYEKYKKNNYSTSLKYIKIPTWCVEKLKEVTIEMVPFMYTPVTGDIIQSFMGFQICETDKISKIDEIELF